MFFKVDIKIKVILIFLKEIILINFYLIFNHVVNMGSCFLRGLYYL